MSSHNSAGSNCMRTVCCHASECSRDGTVRVTAWDLLLGKQQKTRGERGGRRNGIGGSVVGGEDSFWERQGLWFSEV